MVALLSMRGRDGATGAACRVVGTGRGSQQAEGAREWPSRRTWVSLANAGSRSSSRNLPLATSYASVIDAKPPRERPIIFITAVAADSMSAACRLLKGSWVAAATSTRAACKKRWSWASGADTAADGRQEARATASSALAKARLSASRASSVSETATILAATAAFAFLQDRRSRVAATTHICQGGRGGCQGGWVCCSNGSVGGFRLGLPVDLYDVRAR